VQATRCLAFAQVNEGFHGGLQGCDGFRDGRKLKVTLLFLLAGHKGNPR
jgi:hypothetical protein